MQFSSRLMEDAVEALHSLPGIGRKTALRLALHLLRREPQDVERFAGALNRLRQEVQFCSVCHNLSDTPTCSICQNPRRDAKVICVVADFRDVMAIEQTGQFKGLYHVLGGLISPMEGIGPDDLNTQTLWVRLESGAVEEVLLALSTTVEGDTTNFFLYRRLQEMPLNITTIARGIAMGDELEYADELTLGRSIVHRVPYSVQLNTP
jgi:recombination protein RecR